MNTYAFPVIDLVKTGENIKRLRSEHGMSVRDLQEIMGFESPQAIYKWQWGDCLPDIQNLLVMSKLFNVAVDNILVTD